MDQLLSFLFNSLSTGVHYAKYEVDLSTINILYNYINEKIYKGKSHIFKELLDNLESFPSDNKYEMLFDIGIKMLYYIYVNEDNDYMTYYNSIKNEKQIIENNKVYTSNIIYNIYPFAVKQWLNKKDVYYTPDNINELLYNSMKYYNINEWRISIILNAIIVELILSEIFENK